MIYLLCFKHKTENIVWTKGASGLDEKFQFKVFWCVTGITLVSVDFNSAVIIFLDRSPAVLMSNVNSILWTKVQTSLVCCNHEIFIMCKIINKSSDDEEIKYFVNIQYFVHNNQNILFNS